MLSESETQADAVGRDDGGESDAADLRFEDLGIETVAAHTVEASVLGQVANAARHSDRRDGAGAQREKNVLNEIKAITGLLRSQTDAEDDAQGAAAGARDGGVVHAVMRSRLANLRAELHVLKRARRDDEAAGGPDAAAALQATRADDDAWSSDDADAPNDTDVLGGELVETERERMIRNGLITPFDALNGLDRQVTRANTSRLPMSDLQEVDLMAPGAEAKLRASAARYRERKALEAAARPATKLLSLTELPHIEDNAPDAGRRPWVMAKQVPGPAPRKRRRASTLPKERRKGVKLSATRSAAAADDESGSDGSDGDDACDGDDAAVVPDDVVWDADGGEDDDAEPAYTTADGDDYDDTDETWYLERLQRWKDSNLAEPVGNLAVRQAIVDDGDADDSAERQESNAQASTSASPAAGAQRSAAAEAATLGSAVGSAGRSGIEDANGAFVHAPDDSDVKFARGYRIPARVYDQLFPYQQVGVKWMWELHTQRAGGIIGDEMGLGKTVQVAAFLAGLHHSKLFKPSLIVAPLTTLKQWQRELRTWYPPFRVIVLHDMGRSPGGAPRPCRADLVALATDSPCGVLLTTYEQLRINCDLLLPHAWGYVVLDEGHKIRNPDANITLVCKQVRTVHRCIMSGSPIQNSLSELWSLFDFVFPGKLGTLPVFQAQFAVPIAVGGYSNASPLSVSTAYKCAVMLRDLISPYLLRRQKVDVAKQLPAKNEQVLFCKLSPDQRRTYRKYLASRDVSDILAGKRHALEGITILRKICNHVDLLDRVTMQSDPDYGNADRSGKLTVTLKVLEMWKEQGHKALLFTQTQQMLDIIERHARERGFRYHRMDGCTAVTQRYRMMDDFNLNPKVFLFLLTTKVGGIGVNLTGANRVLLYDPDWNPSTDAQARERCWRLGQKRSVTIFRLITRGTIEEKVYHRQIYKQYMTNRILIDPRQKRFLASKDVHDLFTLTDQHHGSGTETGKLFSAVGRELLADDVPPPSSDEDGPFDPPALEDDAAGSPGGVEGAPSEPASASRRTSSAPPKRGASSTQRPDAARSSKKRSRAARAAADVGAEGLERDALADLEDKVAASAARQEDGDASILRELFDGTGLHSALNHHAIESANDPAKLDAERAASKVAERAAQLLKQSRQQVLSQPVHLPTWTGRHGQAGAPGQQRRFGNSISSAVMRPQGLSGAGASASGRAAASPLSAGTQGAALPSTLLIARLREKDPPPEPTAEDQHVQMWMAQVVSFLQAQDGHKALSATLISHFESSVAADKDGSAAVFKQVLKQVAVLKKRNGAPGYWVLKPEFA